MQRIQRLTTRRWLSNFYALFPKTFPNANPTFKIDQAKLRKEYRSLQAIVHPDVQEASSIDPTNAENLTSASLNKAYTTLKDPLKRSEYILKLKNFKLSPEALSNQSLLMEVMETHEILQNCDDKNEADQINEINSKRINQLIEKIDIAYKDNDFENAAKWTTELRYWKGIEAAIKDWQLEYLENQG
ncbi:hypothetical protein TBLA_0A09020 [Henningerozyma blattae CBS 6284]|uniref:J domain-containing protein n=1 Tax=Henningerozyma blattae (strain ATCC 34711 / CBS 6284 / DSM 70876 / NBRC 10599 / NRRL Y-10934 / UCD 77-7) TaxID=1071380 RepID=I2GX38_HENB6|nr:hypothetical protein TBLA_0A09020 [Tetrapisispora blattae CBS 6284]CCH58690.1 hypothetical protein TBLA_0A09020 [Tetrapisispora blattae CBS 6284]